MHMVGIKEISITIVGCLILIAGLSWWYSGGAERSAQEVQDDESIINDHMSDEESDHAVEMINMDNPTATFKTNKGDIQLELFADSMPVTVENFLSLATDGFYDGTKFHRVISGFMIQGGDPNSREDDAAAYGTGGPGYTIQDEFVEGEHLSNVRGTIAMANTGQPNSGGSQFFINVADNTNLDFDKQPLASKHPVFGRVISGMDIVDLIEQVETGQRDVPVEPVIIESIEIQQ